MPIKTLKSSGWASEFAISEAEPPTFEYPQKLDNLGNGL
jgi:hypothetical protein